MDPISRKLYHRTTLLRGKLLSYPFVFTFTFLGFRFWTSETKTSEEATDWSLEEKNEVFHQKFFFDCCFEVWEWTFLLFPLRCFFKCFLFSTQKAELENLLKSGKMQTYFWEQSFPMHANIFEICVILKDFWWLKFTSSNLLGDDNVPGKKHASEFHGFHAFIFVFRRFLVY